MDAPWILSPTQHCETRGRKSTRYESPREPCVLRIATRQLHEAYAIWLDIKTSRCTEAAPNAPVVCILEGWHVSLCTRWPRLFSRLALGDDGLLWCRIRQPCLELRRQTLDRRVACRPTGVYAGRGCRFLETSFRCCNINSSDHSSLWYNPRSPSLFGGRALVLVESLVDFNLSSLRLRTASVKTFR